MQSCGRLKDASASNVEVCDANNYSSTRSREVPPRPVTASVFDDKENLTMIEIVLIIIVAAIFAAVNAARIWVVRFFRRQPSADLELQLLYPDPVLMSITNGQEHSIRVYIWLEYHL